MPHTFLNDTAFLSLCLYAFSLPAVVHPVEEDKGYTRVQWLARKFELMASAKYRPVSERLLLASNDSSRRSSIGHNEHIENLVVSKALTLIDNIDELYWDDDQEQEDKFLEYAIQSDISDIYEEDKTERDIVMSETSSINDGSILITENIAANVAMFFYENEQTNSHTAVDGSITFLR